MLRQIETEARQLLNSLVCANESGHRVKTEISQLEKMIERFETLRIRQEEEEKEQREEEEAERVRTLINGGISPEKWAEIEKILTAK